MNVFIDPGHGGKDKGASSGPYVESHIALEVSQILKHLLDQDPNFSASISRTSDQFIPLPDRVLLGIKNNTDIFISIHVNASSDPTIYGSEVYFTSQLPIDKEALIHTSYEFLGELPQTPPMTIPRQKELPQEVVDIILDLKRNNNLFLSGELSKAISNNWRIPNSQIRQIQQAPFFVINQAHTPAVLIELGFITHPAEAQLLSQKSHQKKLAQSIYKGLKVFQQKF